MAVDTRYSDRRKTAQPALLDLGAMREMLELLATIHL